MTFWSSYTGDQLNIGMRPVTHSNMLVTSPDWWISNTTPETKSEEIADTFGLARQIFQS